MNGSANISIDVTIPYLGFHLLDWTKFLRKSKSRSNVRHIYEFAVQWCTSKTRFKEVKKLCTHFDKLSEGKIIIGDWRLEIGFILAMFRFETLYLFTYLSFFLPTHFTVKKGQGLMKINPILCRKGKPIIQTKLFQ